MSRQLLGCEIPDYEDKINELNQVKSLIEKMEKGGAVDGYLKSLNKIFSGIKNNKGRLREYRDLIEKSKINGFYKLKIYRTIDGYLSKLDR